MSRSEASKEQRRQRARELYQERKNDPEYQAKKSIKNRETYLRHHESRKQRMMEYRVSGKRPKADPKKSRAYHIAKKYGMTEEDYTKKFNSQGRVCAICSKEHVCGEKAFHIDHDHRTGAVRGILCTSCNVALGLVQDSTNILISMATYLMSHEDMLTKESALSLD